ncbi:MAG: hypothetical protein LC672_06865 [Acidobacteria bacterium]|nr:hypothetical protein [Acidobacteriota bacterium]
MPTPPREAPRSTFRSLLNAAIAQTYRRYPHLEDEDIAPTLHIALKYQEVVRRYNREQSRR